MELDRALRISAAGMEAQSSRLRVVAENLSNRDTTSEVAGGDPYRRKTITFTNRFDRALGANIVRVSRLGTAPGEFQTRFDPGIPLRTARVMLRSRMSIPPLK